MKYQIKHVAELRHRAWNFLHSIVDRDECLDANWIARATHRICVLLSSSRGGSSAAAELLQWQGSNNTETTGRLLTLPGEEKPYLILVGLGFPARDQLFDDLTESDAKGERISQLFSEVASDIGWPMVYTNRLDLYAIQLYRRLLLQWPADLMKLEMRRAITDLGRSLQNAFPSGYRDNLDNRRRVLDACIRCFPFIRSSFYDCSANRNAKDLTLWVNGPWSIEEAPFVLPPPWHNATPEELEQGCLLLRDPSNAWRLPFWQATFPTQPIEILHLVRDPRESVQGLCDGWNYPFGFQSIVRQRSVNIVGYTDILKIRGNRWTQQCLNFSIDKSLSQILQDQCRNISLVDVCAHQWRQAHATILMAADTLGLSRCVVDFGALRESTEEVFRKICREIRLECSQSGLECARSFAERLIMATNPRNGSRSTRWKNSFFTSEIEALVAGEYFDDVCEKLGMGRISSIEDDNAFIHPDIDTLPDTSVGMRRFLGLAGISYA
jgi:hypothetical protein